MHVSNEQMNGNFGHHMEGHRSSEAEQSRIEADYVSANCVKQDPHTAHKPSHLRQPAVLKWSCLALFHWPCASFSLL
jgi:hypothetical protein